MQKTQRIKRAFLATRNVSFVHHVSIQIPAADSIDVDFMSGPSKQVSVTGDAI